MKTRIGPDLKRCKKVPFSTAEDAVIVLRQMPNTTNLGIYKCSECDQYHIGYVAQATAR